jgi:Tfp pilus assembly protein PilE
MMAIAILAILTAVALPSFKGSVRKSVRLEAPAWRMSAAARRQQLSCSTGAA